MSFEKINTPNELLNRIQSNIEKAFLSIGLIGSTAIAVSTVGDLKQSLLSEKQFIRLNGNNWVLADGRSIKGSAFATLSGLTNIPDMRGKFTRMASTPANLRVVQTDATAINGISGSTIVSSNPTISRTGNSSISGTTGSGGAHNHNLTDHLGQLYYNDFTGGGAGYLIKPTVVSPQSAVSNAHLTTLSTTHTHSISGSATGGTWGATGGSYSTTLSSTDTETRPENIALNYFVKVN